MLVSVVASLTASLMLTVVPAAPHGSAGCTQVPRDVSGETVPAAIARTPNLSTLNSALSATGLAEGLGRAAEVTVFAPADEALAGQPSLDVLRYHVVPRRLNPDQLAGAHQTLQGGTVDVARQGAGFRLNAQAGLICTRMQAANGNVYLIDAVLTPR